MSFFRGVGIGVGLELTMRQRDMELLVLDNLKSAIQHEKLLTQVPEQKDKAKI